MQAITANSPQHFFNIPASELDLPGSNAAAVASIVASGNQKVLTAVGAPPGRVICRQP